MNQNLLKRIDKIYCINLDRRPDRWELASAEFKKHNLQVERFSAVDGHAVKHKDRLKLKPGLHGCTMSHYLIIDRARELGYETIMIFEDDVVLHDQFVEQLAFILVDLPSDWHMLMLGGSHRLPPTPLPGVKYMRVNKTLTSHGYVIRHTFYSRLLAKLADMKTPIDCAFADLQPYNKIYVPDPPLAWQRAGFSDIENREMDYPWIQTNEQ